MTTATWRDTTPPYFFWKGEEIGEMKIGGAKGEIKQENKAKIMVARIKIGKNTDNALSSLFTRSDT